MRTVMFFAHEYSWKAADQGGEESPAETVRDAVVVFVHVEPGDDDKGRKTVTRFLKQLKQIARKWETKNIVLYPFSHLGEEKADVEVANELLDQMRERLEKVEYRVSCTQFGQFVDFTMSSPGARLSRVFRQF